MPIDVKDAARLSDIAKAAEAVAQFIQGSSETEYDKNLLLRSAVERQIEIIGEATRSISAALKAQHTEIPWRKISATRNILVHDYGMIKNDIVWKIAAVHIPELLVLIRPLLQAPPVS